ncbi:hypothetical protein [Variovorax sp. RA8]|uniref:hypothetical protein n=1 Tax=Variovorax sp. (strain JCM 16519 / RA8) TaxID=662548 RepID=UPI00131871FA|nr:hypothetical protein [Variovorax sp. RA8]VTU16870.1 hypothetical protein RA8CHR_01376 [Variovorax sp. RA8]
MTVPLAASLLDLVLGLQLGPSDKAAANRCSIEGATWASRQEGVIDVRIRELEAAALRLASGAIVLEIGRIAVHELAGEVRIESGVPRLSALGAAQAEFSGVKLHGPLRMSPQLQEVRDALLGPGRAASSSTDGTARQAAAEAWCLGPLGEADGTIRGEITDAHLLFDADVTVPIRHGQIDFNDATVEHVGPDSRMGVSRLGFYVDAPNGRSYLYQFASAPLAGVEFERRGALLSPWVSERGKLRLQAFAESMLRQGRGGHGQGLTEQARLLLGRTALSGEVQLGDGRLAVPGLQARMEGRSEGRNAVGLRSEAVGRGLTVEMASLSARDAAAKWKGAQLACDEITARVRLQLFAEGREMRFVLELENGKMAGPRLDLRRPESA